MGGNSNYLKVDRDSRLGVLALAAEEPGRLPPDHPFLPCKSYLASLAEGGVRAQRVNLERAARLILGDKRASIMDFDWRSLRFQDVLAVRKHLVFRGFSASVVNGTLAALRRVAHLAWRLGAMDVEDLEMIRDVKRVGSDQQKRAGRALTGREIKLLFDTCERAGATAAGARDACLLALLYGGGLRCGEALKLDLEDWDPRRHRLRVRGKGSRDRTVSFLDGGARRAINNWLRRRGRDPGPLLCPVDRHGRHFLRRLGVTTIFRALARRAAEAGVGHFSAHDLRRSAATEIYRRSHDIKLVRDFLGHVFIQTTEIYIRTKDEAGRRAAEKLKVPYRVPGGGRGRRKHGRRRSRWRQNLRTQQKFRGAE